MPLAIPIIVLLALLVSMGMAAVSRPLSGGFVGWLKDHVGRLPVFGAFGLVAILKLDRWLSHHLGVHFRAIEHRGVRWFRDLAHYVDAVGYWSLYWPIGLLHAVTHLTTVTIPRAIRAKTEPLERRTEAAEAQAKAASGIAHRVPKVVRAHDRIVPVTRIERVAMPHANEWDWIHEHFHALQHTVRSTATEAVAVPLPHAPAWIGRTARQVRWHARRLKRLEALLGVTGMAVAMARVFGLPNWRCLTRGNIGRAARHFCGLDKWLVDLLLLGSVEAFVATDMCEFTHLLGIAAKAQRPILMDLVSVENALVGCHGTTKPAAFVLPSADLPPLQGASPLAA